jgi:hypothetical protein
MIRFLIRFLGIWILAGAFIALVYDGTKTIASNAVHITPLGLVWRNVHASSLLLLQPGIERHVAPWLWPPIQTVLEQPAWLVFGILGALLILLGRKKKPLIGYARD